MSFAVFLYYSDSNVEYCKKSTILRHHKTPVNTSIICNEGARLLYLAVPEIFQSSVDHLFQKINFLTKHWTCQTKKHDLSCVF